MASLIQGIHHIAIKYDSVEKFEEAIRFYHELLGMPVARTWGEGESIGAMIDTGSGILEIFASGKGLGNGKIAHIALATKDVDLCIETVRKAGYAVIMAPKDIVIASKAPFPARIAFCQGPGGEEVEFFCEK